MTSTNLYGTVIANLWWESVKNDILVENILKQRE